MESYSLTNLISNSRQSIDGSPFLISLQQLSRPKQKSVYDCPLTLMLEMKTDRVVEKRQRCLARFRTIE